MAIDARFKLAELYVADADASARFYGDVLGFQIGHTHHEEGKLDWCQLLQGNRPVLHLHHRPDLASGGPRGALLFDTCELDALHARLKTARHAVSDVSLQSYGAREFTLDDPDGYTLLFQQWADGHAQNEESPVANTIPVLAVADLQAAIAFYTQKLEFGLEWGGEAGSHICSVGRDNKSIMLRQESIPRPGEVWIGGSGLRARWQAAQADPTIKVVQPPTNQPWALELRIADPDGNILWFGTDPLKDVPFGTVCPNP